jgi:hypothetical protein
VHHTLTREQDIADEIVRRAGGDAATFDLNHDGVVELAEAVGVALTRSDLKPFRELLDEVGAKHPLDLTKAPPELIDRIQRIATETERKITRIPRSGVHRASPRRQRRSLVSIPTKRS